MEKMYGVFIKHDLNIYIYIYNLTKRRWLPFARYSRFHALRDRQTGT